MPVKDDEKPTELAYGDLQNVGDCHEECTAKGCHQSRSATGCFECRYIMQNLRNTVGFKCINRCETGSYLDETDGRKLCKKCPSQCASCSQPELCDSCPGTRLLIDVDHYGHLDHRHCVESCPQGLTADYLTNPLQPRCILPGRICSKGYYHYVNSHNISRCLPCHKACALCHGPSPVQCDTCAIGYGNLSFGYCRPCCGFDENADGYQCEDCTLKPIPYSNPVVRNWTLFVCFLVFLFFICCFSCLMYRDRKYDKGNVDYNLIPVRYELGNANGIFLAESVRNGLTIINDSEDSDGN